MKAKRIITLAIAFLIALVLCAVSFRTCRSQREEIKRLNDNQESLMRSFERIPVTDSTDALDVARLVLSVDELAESNKDVVSLCNKLDVKLKRLESAMTARSTTELSISTPVHDTIIRYIDNTPVHAETFEWNDNYVHIQGILDKDSATCNIKSYDTITQIVYRVPRQWLFFKFGTKAIRQSLYSSNPHSNLTYSEYVEVLRE